MTEFTDLCRYLGDHRDELAARAGQPEEFRRELGNLERFWADESDDRVAEGETWRVLTRYPGVLQALREQGFHAADPPMPTLAPVGPSRTPVTTSEAGSIHPNTAPGPALPDPRTVWVASRLALGREIVAATLAVIIVITSVVVLLFSLFRVGSGQNEAAREALLFLNGIVGVVLGYYFGRVPAETRAERADISARKSELELQNSMAEVQSVLDEMTSMSRTRGTGDGAQLTPEQIGRLRALVRTHR